MPAILTHGNGMTRDGTSQGWRDVRRAGFASRVPLAEARVRLTALLRPTGTERVPLRLAAGRVTAVEIVAAQEIPAEPRALIDGYALRAAVTFGADAYNPLPVAGAVEVVAGAPMPPATDVVLPYAAVTEQREVVEPAAAGSGVAAEGSWWRRGELVLPMGRVLRGLDLAGAIAAGLTEIEVVRRPLIRLLARGGKAGAEMLAGLAGLVARDGGVVRSDAGELAATGDADLVLVVGGTGCGRDDDSAPRLAAAGRVEVHGVAIAPGGSAGFGTIAGVPVLLLPGDPLAGFAAYELLAGPALRRLAGLPEGLPHPRRERRLGAKIASQVGTTELWLVGDRGDAVVPLAPPDRANLAHAARASGFVLVEPESEGHDVGNTVTVHQLWVSHG